MPLALAGVADVATLAILVTLATDLLATDLAATDIVVVVGVAVVCGKIRFNCSTGLQLQPSFF